MGVILQLTKEDLPLFERFVAQSVAFLCDPNNENEALVTEGTSLVLNDAPKAIQGVVSALESLETQVLDLPKSCDMDGIVLRYGHFYGPNTFYAPDGWITSLIKNGQYPIIKDGQGSYSFINVEDAAEATVQAISHGETGIYNIVDDSPTTLKDWTTTYSKLLAADPPVELPTGTDKIDPFTTFFMTKQKGVDNQKAKTKLDWKPQTPSWSNGFEKILK